MASKAKHMNRSSYSYQASKRARNMFYNECAQKATARMMRKQNKKPKSFSDMFSGLTKVMAALKNNLTSSGNQVK